jgi:hypothetical protein
MSSLTALADPAVGAAVVTLDANTITDTFTRSVSSGWGSADSGQAWTTSGGSASDFSVNGTKGVQSAGTVAVLRHSLIPVGADDMRVRATIDLDTGAVTGNTATSWVAGRVTDTSNYYAAQLTFQTDDTVRLAIIERVGGTLTGLSATLTIATSFAAGEQFTVELEVSGSTLRAKAWATATETDPGWLLTVEDTSLTTGTQAGLLSRLETGNTNALPVLFRFDNVAALEAGDLWHVHRVYPDGTQTEVLGSPAYLSGGLAVFWDTVLPLDTAIFYRATSDDSATTLTSNTITVTGTGQGWLKDPAQPVNDILLDVCPDRTCPNTSTGVSFQSLGQGQFASASGVFPQIDAARPRTVAQLRKARTSTLALLSHSLDDGLAVEDILASGRNLALQLAARYGWAPRLWNIDYIAVGDVNEDRPNVSNQTYVQRSWAIPFAVARAPFVATHQSGGNGIGVNGATYGDATATGRTYTQRTATGNTYLMSSRGENL